MQTTPISALYADLFAGNRVTVRMADKRAYDSLRVALHKQHQTPRLLLELTDDALCARWDATMSVATFWLGAPRSRRIPFTILTVEDVNSLPVTVAESNSSANNT